MNPDQVMSLVRGVLLSGGIAGMTSSYFTATQWEAVVGGVIAIVSVLWSQVFHANKGA